MIQMVRYRVLDMLIDYWLMIATAIVLSATYYTLSIHPQMIVAPTTVWAVLKPLQSSAPVIDDLPIQTDFTEHKSTDLVFYDLSGKIITVRGVVICADYVVCVLDLPVELGVVIRLRMHDHSLFQEQAVFQRRFGQGCELLLTGYFTGNDFLILDISGDQSEPCPNGPAAQHPKAIIG